MNQQPPVKFGQKPIKIDERYAGIIWNIVRLLPALLFWSAAKFNISFHIKFYLIFAVLSFYLFDFFKGILVYEKRYRELSKRNESGGGIKLVLNRIVIVIAVVTVIKIIIDFGVHLDQWLWDFAKYK